MNASMPGEPRNPGDADDVAATPVPAYHASMDKRLSILEMRFDTLLPTLATKVDLAEFRTEVLTGQERLRVELLSAMHDLHRSLLMWIVSTMMAMFLGMVGLFVSISSNMLETTERMMQAQVRAIESAHAAKPVPSPSP